MLSKEVRGACDGVPRSQPQPHDLARRAGPKHFFQVLDDVEPLQHGEHLGARGCGPRPLSEGAHHQGLSQGLLAGDSRAINWAGDSSSSSSSTSYSLAASRTPRLHKARWVQPPMRRPPRPPSDLPGVRLGASAHVGIGARP